MNNHLNERLIPLHLSRLPDVSSLVPLAERYVNHTFRLLGSAWTKVHYGMQAPGFEGTNYSDPGVTLHTALEQLPEDNRAGSRELLKLADRLVPGYEPIDWLIDFKSGYRFPPGHFRTLAYGLVHHVDAKVPYDLSRHYHFVVLALSWKATGDEKYRKQLLAQMVDWIAVNPYEYGIGWHSNMNVAIRAVNWITALSIVAEGSDWSDPDEAIVESLLWRSLLQHRRYMSANLEFPETDFHPNHYIANLAGLLLTSLVLEERDVDSASWRMLALRELRLEIDRQFGEDGFNFESTTSYHAFSLEMLVYPLLLAARASGCVAAPDIRGWLNRHLETRRMEKIRRAFAALRDITQQNGLIPLIGDADAGRLLCLETPGHEARDWKFLSCVGAALFAEPSLLPEGVAHADNTAAGILLGAAPVPTVHTPDHAQYPDAGFYLMKDRSLFSLIFCGPIGTGGKGGHAHDDKLSFTLSLNGKELLVDPGVYVYTASRRYRDDYRSAEAHNTVTVCGEPQNRPLADSFWWGMHEDTRCRVLEWSHTPERAIFAGEHRGYARLQRPLVHRRRFEWLKRENQMTIVDRFDATEPAAATAVAHAPANPSMKFALMLHPDCTVRLARPDCAVVDRDGQLLTIETGHGEWMLQEGFFSPEYGVKQASTKLVLEFAAGPAENRMRLYW